MPELRVGDLVQATGGYLVCGDAQTVVRSYDIDTRRLHRESLFFALRGEHSDGHEFLDQARQRGAAAAVIERTPEELERAPGALILVDDVDAALGRCGAWVRHRLRATKWIAVTGSNGKTTTKEMLAAGLSASFRVHRSPGNFNNHLGVPLALLACPTDAEVAVLELAMSGPGEIADLARMTDPDIGLVTNVRAAHMEAFRSLDDIAAAKGELFAVMRDDAIAVVNLDDPHVRVQAARHDGPRITFGQQALSEVRLEDLNNRFVPGAWLKIRYQDRELELDLRIGGAHSAFNALAALAAVVAAGGDVDGAAERVQQLEPGPGRGQVHHLRRGMMMVDDSYNSSPSALASILESLRCSEPAGRRVLITGDMLELGHLEVPLHREAGKRAASAGVELLIAVGALSRNTAEVARRAGVPEVHQHADASRAAGQVVEFLRDGDLIAVKGSRAMHMEQVVQTLLELLGPDSEEHSTGREHREMS